MERLHVAPLLSVKMTAAVVTDKHVLQARAVQSLSKVTAAAAAWAMRSQGAPAAQMGWPE